MKIKYLEVKNYRSIGEVAKTQIQDYSVFIGPNNQGKSNLIRALNLSMQALRIFSQQRLRRQQETGRTPDLNNYLLMRRTGWDWKTDYPLFKQSQKSHPNTSFRIDFELNDEENDDFYNLIKVKCNGNLPIRITFSENSANIESLKQGRGSKTYQKNIRKIAKFIVDRIEIVTIPAIRTLDEAKPIFSALVNEKINEISSTERYRELLDEINTLRKDAVDLANEEIKETINRYIPSIEAVNIKSDEVTYEADITDILVSSGGIETSLNNQGEGIKSLVTLSLLHQRALKRSNSIQRSYILIVDEPESHLHPKSIHELRSLLESMALDHQVIIATHNPVFINRNNISSNIIIENNKARPAIKVSDIRETLGVKVQDNLTSAETIILCEGLTDEKILKRAITEFDDDTSISNLIDDGQIVIKPTNGTSKIVKHINFEKTTLCKIIVVTDNDSAGRKKIQEIKQNRLLDERFIHILSPSSGGYRDTEIEDFINPDIYTQELAERFGRPFERSHFLNRSKKWSQKFLDAANSMGLSSDDNVSNLESAKIIVAETVQNIEINPFIEGFRQPIEALIYTLKS